ncbi:TetR family transcriptional regulator [Bombiscardovia nodaiensis]|uniref:TetR family transcriptional regulator n=1 Tax=Bombiscardovia nodaiensis TaxID=2932181 RepID=A0ABM8B9F2_9BIFI|nr:TetR family transcriptional regulator [Bombiscardovia nodaiensis]
MPLRSDAARNREKLLEAGRQVFARRGLGATLNDVAEQAGVGVGTAYRHFANKGELIEAISVGQVNELEGILRRSLANPDAWAGLVDYLERSMAMQTRDKGFAQLFAGRYLPSERYDWGRDRLAPMINQVAARAREQGAIRPEITGTDLIFIQIGILGIAETLNDGAAKVERTDVDQLYRRYLWIALAGIRASQTHAEAQDTWAGWPQPIPALTTQETHQILSGPATASL